MLKNVFMLQADFGGTDGTGNFTAEYPASIGYPDLVDDATGKGGSAVNHCHQDSPDFQAGIQLPLYPHHRFEKLFQALGRKVVGLHRDDDGIGRCQCVDGQHPQRRHTVHNGVVIVFLDGAEILP